MLVRKEKIVMTYKASPDMSVGHAHLKVSDLQRSVDWYCSVLGFDVMQQFGDQAAFLSAGGYHHHLGLNTWHSRGGTPPPDRVSLDHSFQDLISSS